MQIRERYSSIKKLNYFNLLNHEKFDFFKQTFPNSEFDALRDFYPAYFDFVRLKNELVAINSSEEFSKKKTVYEILSFLNENDLQNVFSEVYNLSILIMTILYSTASVERSFSA